MAAEPVAPVQPFIRRDMRQGQAFPLAGGRAVVFSARCPDKESANEDAAALVLCNDTRGVIVLADGFGGQPAGDQASERAVQAVVAAVQAADEAGQTLRAGILDGFERANQAVLELGVGAATTLVAVELDDGCVRPYHVGDSEVLVVGQRGKVKLQTVSHSPVGYGVEAGLIEARDALQHEDRHLVLNMVGAAGMRIEVGPPLRLQPRDTLVVGSDGLFDNLHANEVVRLVRTGPLSAVVKRLATACTERMRAPAEGAPSKPDDLTFVVFRLG